MQTLKTSFVTICLVMIMYGAYVAINAPPVSIPPELGALVEDNQNLQIDDGALDLPDIETPPFAQSFADASNTTGPLPSESGVQASIGDGAITSLQSGEGVTASLGSTDDGQFNTSLPPINKDSSTAGSGSLSAAPLLTEALPKPPAESPEISIDSTQQYPSTPMADLSLSAPSDQSSSPTQDDSGTQVPSINSSSSDPTESNDGGFVMPNQPLTGDTSPADADGGPTDLTQTETENSGFTNAIQTADRQVAAGELREALFTLSLFYGSPDLTSEQRQQLMPRLNALAGEVIYSQRHLVESAYRVEPGDSLEKIAASHQVPVQLLANINGISDPSTLTPGTELKVLTGPFRAEVNLAQSQMALFLGDLYAGVFPIQVGNSPAPVEGTFAVNDKQRSRAYYGPDGTTFAAGDPRNPFGEYWLDLGNRLSIHGSPSMQPDKAGLGCIQLRAADARDIFGILSKGSSVTVRR